MQSRPKTIMIVKLYSTLRLEYAKSREYDARNGIAVPLAESVSLRELCTMIGIDDTLPKFATADGVIVKDFDVNLSPDVSEVGLHPQAPAGG